MLDTAFFKSMAEQDDCPVVICNTEHEIIYINPAAVTNYAKYGGSKIVGQSIFSCHNSQSEEIIKKVVAWFDESTENNRVHTSFSKTKNRDVYMIALRDESKKLIGYYEKHEFRNRDMSPLLNFE